VAEGGALHDAGTMFTIDTSLYTGWSSNQQSVNTLPRNNSGLYDEQQRRLTL